MRPLWIVNEALGNAKLVGLSRPPLPPRPTYGSSIHLTSYAERQLVQMHLVRRKGVFQDEVMQRTSAIVGWRRLSGPPSAIICSTIQPGLPDPPSITASEKLATQTRGLLGTGRVMSEWISATTR